MPCLSTGFDNARRTRFIEMFDVARRYDNVIRRLYEETRREETPVVPELEEPLSRLREQRTRIRKEVASQSSEQLFRPIRKCWKIWKITSLFRIWTCSENLYRFGTEGARMYSPEELSQPEPGYEGSMTLGESEDRILLRRLKVRKIIDQESELTFITVH